MRSQEPSGSLQELGSTLLAAPPGPPALPGHRGSFGKCQAAGCPSSERGGGDHNGKRRSGQVLRGQGCSSWGEVTGLHPLSVPRAHMISRSRPFFGAMCQLGSFPSRVAQAGPRVPVCACAMATRHHRRPHCLWSLPEMMTASHCLMQIVCDNGNLCSLQQQHGFPMPPRPSRAKRKV